jgi:predicted PurR-regulated permease PerM
MPGSDVTRTAAKATAAAVAVVALAFGLWKVRSIVILLLLALTFAAAIRPGVEWLRRRGVPQQRRASRAAGRGTGATTRFGVSD